MKVILCFLKLSFFGKKLRNMKMSRIVLVSGLWAPPGPRLGGPHYGSYLVCFEISIFWKQVAKHENVKNRIGIWTLDPYTLTPDRPPLAAHILIVIHTHPICMFHLFLDVNVYCFCDAVACQLCSTGCKGCQRCPCPHWAHGTRCLGVSRSVLQRPPRNLSTTFCPCTLPTRCRFCLQPPS